MDFGRTVETTVAVAKPRYPLPEHTWSQPESTYIGMLEKKVRFAYGFK